MDDVDFLTQIQRGNDEQRDSANSGVFFSEGHTHSAVSQPTEQTVILGTEQESLTLISVFQLKPLPFRHFPQRRA